jgi:hypothetical protein
MAIKEAFKKPVKVSYVQLTGDTLDEALEFIDNLPRRAIWNHPTGGFSEWDNRQEGDSIGILVFSTDGLLRAIVTDGSYVIKDQEGDYLFMTAEQFDSQFDIPPVKTPEPTKTPNPTLSTDNIQVPTVNTKSSTTENTKSTTDKAKKSTK